MRTRNEMQITRKEQSLAQCGADNTNEARNDDLSYWDESGYW